ncbi:MAG: isochorismate synthase [Microbacter sp.]
MITNINHIDIIDQLIGKELGLVLYRLPGESEPSLLLSLTNQTELLEDYSLLNDKEGFVMAPFHCDAAHPVVLLHPEIMVTGMRAMDDFLQSEAAEQWLSLRSKPAEKPPLHLLISEKKAYEYAFTQFLQALTQGEANKLVLSRCHVEERNEEIKPGATFLKACRRYPDAFVYLFYTPFTGLWIGSTPEMLLSGMSPHFQTVALAGTKPIASDGKAIRWDAKNKQEQQWVVTYLKELFTEMNIDWRQSTTQSIKAGNMIHLKTPFVFSFYGKAQLGDLLKKLHPTPAVCGFPKEKAFRFILDHEGYDRTYYSGFVGKISVKDQTNLYVNLRCMEWNSNQIRLYAGGGLLNSSRLLTEWKETETKLQTMLTLLHAEKT